MKEIKKGIYRHYKGNEYRIIGEATETETKDDLVIYQDIHDQTRFWARPKTIFLAPAEVDGKKQPRFTWLRNEVEAIVEDSPETDASNCDFEHKYKRALADYQNLLKQTAKDKEEFVKYALSDFLEDILPVYDHLKMSLAGLGKEESKNPWVEGVRHVLKQFKEVLTARGLEEIETKGEKFDHNTMEAVDGSGETVKQEIRPGYKLNGKVIRPAKVIVE